MPRKKGRILGGTLKEGRKGIGGMLKEGSNEGYWRNIEGRKEIGGIRKKC
jgi:hypothetical protein